MKEGAEVDNRELENKEILDFIRENIDNEKYRYVKGKVGVKDIVVTKGLTFENMTPKQEVYVKSVYSAMKGIDNKEQQEDSVVVEDNKKYPLTEKPEVIMKIQRLQNEVSDKTPQITKDIIATIMKYRTISEKQLRHINDAYISLVVEGKDTVSMSYNSNSSNSSSGTNRRYTLEDRPDIKEKIDKIMSSNLYFTLPDKEYQIVQSVNKYKTVSDKQIFYIEEAYKRLFG